MNQEKTHVDKIMKTKIFLLLGFLSFGLKVLCSQNGFTFEECINRSFQGNHINKWRIINTIESTNVSDSFTLLEGRIGDTSYSEIENIVSLILTRNLTLIAEHDEKAIYLLPNRNNGKAVKLNTFLPDSMNSYIIPKSDYLLDSIGKNIYTTFVDGEALTIGIDPKLGIVEFIELDQSEIEETEDNNGFVTSRIVKRKIRYTLIYNSLSIVEIGKVISFNRFVKKINEEIKPTGYYGLYELYDFINEIEN